MTPILKHPLRTSLLVLTLAAVPFSASADGHKKHRGHDGHHGASYVRGCPPGLAKKSPACVPPGLARKAERRYDHDHDHDHRHVYYVGERVPSGYILVRDPSRYGLGLPPYGSQYVISDGQLMRVDSGTMKVLNLVRAVDAVLN